MKQPPQLYIQKKEWSIRQPQHASANSSSGCFFNINEEQELREQAKRLNQIAKNRIIWTPKVKAKPEEPNVFGISKEALHTKGKGSTSPAMEKREERYKLYC